MLTEMKPICKSRYDIYRINGNEQYLMLMCSGTQSRLVRCDTGETAATFPDYKNIFWAEPISDTEFLFRTVGMRYAIYDTAQEKITWDFQYPCGAKNANCDRRFAWLGHGWIVDSYINLNSMKKRRDIRPAFALNVQTGEIRGLTDPLGKPVEGSLYMYGQSDSVWMAYSSYYNEPRFDFLYRISYDAAADRILCTDTEMDPYGLPLTGTIDTKNEQIYLSHLCRKEDGSGGDLTHFYRIDLNDPTGEPVIVMDAYSPSMGDGEFHTSTIFVSASGRFLAAEYSLNYNPNRSAPVEGRWYYRIYNLEAGRDVFSFWIREEDYSQWIGDKY